MKNGNWFVATALAVGLTGFAAGQGSNRVQTPAAPATGGTQTGVSGTGSSVKAPAGQAPAGQGAGKTPAGQAPAKAPLVLQSLDPATRADPFPPANPKFFTASSPSLATVDSYLRALLGYDANRIWRVEAIQKTAAPGITRVVVYVTDRSSGAKVQTATFFVTPDGKHAIADFNVTPFGAQPFAENRGILMERATGPGYGAASKDLELVEFTDLQCPHCKEAQAVIKRLAEDFPKARIVVENFPLVEIHPWAFRAAAYGVCVAQKSNEAFLLYAQAVYDTQGALTEDTGEETLKNAATKAGQDATMVSACAATEAAKDQVNVSVKLAEDLGISETPTLVVNGRPLPLTIPYETLKSMIVYQAGLDGVGPAAVSPPGHGLIGR